MKAFAGAALLIAFFITLFAGQPAYGQISFGVQIGQPPEAPIIVGVQPRQPTPGYVWVDGYWMPYPRNYQWFGGQWAVPPYSGARWVAPRYQTDRYYYGYWEGHRGRAYPDYMVDWYRTHDGGQYRHDGHDKKHNDKHRH